MRHYQFISKSIAKGGKADLAIEIQLESQRDSVVATTGILP